MALSIKNKPNIILIGFMGAGKTTIGRIAAEQAGYGFLETDSEIEKRLNSKIADIFKQFGENYFRRIERSVCEDVGKKNGFVISTGGGVVKTKENRLYLKQNGTIIYLKASALHLYNNLKDNVKDRPLLSGIKDEDMLNVIEAMLNERREAYHSFADVIVNVDGLTVEGVSKELLRIIGGNK